MKKIFILFFSLILINKAASQLICPGIENKKKYNSKYIDSPISIFQIGIGVGLSKLKGDREHPNANGQGIYANLDVRITKGLFVGLRTQFGNLWMESGAPPLFDSRELFTKYSGFGGGILFFPFDFFEEEDRGKGDLSLKRYFLNALSVEIDILNISNHIQTIYRNSKEPNTFGPIDYFEEDGAIAFKDRLNSLILPSLNFGFSPMVNFRKMKNSSGKYILRFVANAQFNYANNDLLDGYTPVDEKGHRINTGNDTYRFYSLGLKYSF